MLKSKAYLLGCMSFLGAVLLSGLSRMAAWAFLYNSSIYKNKTEFTLKNTSYTFTK